MNTYTDSDGKTWNLLTAEEVHGLFISLFSSHSPLGDVKFSLAGHVVKAKTKDIIGNLIENWVRDWLLQNNVYGRPNPNSQTAPDVFLLPDDNQHGCLEIKAFYGDANFDVADFLPFAKNLDSNIWQLDEDILIFQYDMNETTGDVSIVKVYLKKLWQICGYCADRSIKVQAKNTQINKIRPVAWYSENAQYKPFASVEDFLAAVKFLYNDVESNLGLRTSWSLRVERAYREFYGRSISIPDYSRLTDSDKCYSFEKKHYTNSLKSEKAQLTLMQKELKNAAKEKDKSERIVSKLISMGVLTDDETMISAQAIRDEKTRVFGEIQAQVNHQEEAIREIASKIERINTIRQAIANKLVY